jgi:MATE family multidrug resistance protein
VTLAANAVLNNFLLVSAFFLDGLANAAEQLCGRAYGARDRASFSSATRLVVLWGMVFALAVSAVFALFGPALIDVMTASQDVRHNARLYLIFVIASPLLAVFAFGFDGVYIGATWARDMRNLMVASLVIFSSAPGWRCARSAMPGCGARCWCITPRAAGWKRCAIAGCSGHRLKRERSVFSFSPPAGRRLG